MFQQLEAIELQNQEQMLTLPPLPTPSSRFTRVVKPSQSVLQLNALTKAEHLVLQNLLVLKRAVPQCYPSQMLPLVLRMAGCCRSSSTGG